VGEESQERRAAKLKRTVKKSGFYASVISHKRPKNVPLVESICGPATWYVGKGESAEYVNAGASSVVEAGGLCESRNAAIDDGQKLGLPVVQMSDDLKKLSLATGSHKQRDASFEAVVLRMLGAAQATGARLVGVAPTANPFYFNPNKATQTRGFVVGDFILVLKTDLRFDQAMRLKEDYDYTLQHIRKYGLVARANDVLATFVHRSNPGGACDYRTERLEQQMIAYLKGKWPGLIRDNPRRPNEILLKA